MNKTHCSFIFSINANKNSSLTIHIKPTFKNFWYVKLWIKQIFLYKEKEKTIKKDLI